VGGVYGGKFGPDRQSSDEDSGMGRWESVVKTGMKQE